MAGLGKTSIDRDRDKKAIGMFLSSSGTKSADSTTEKYTIQKGVKLSDRQNENLSDLKAALGTSNDGEALRWALDKIFELKGDEIKEIAAKKRSVSLS